MTCAALSCADRSDHGAKPSRAQGQLKLATVGNLARGDLLAAILTSGGALGLTLLSAKASKAAKAVRHRLQAAIADSSCAVCVCALVPLVFKLRQLILSVSLDGTGISRNHQHWSAAYRRCSQQNQLASKQASMESQLPARREARLRCAHVKFVALEHAYAESAICRSDKLDSVCGFLHEQHLLPELGRRARMQY